MRATVVLIPTMEEQRAVGRVELIDPAGVKQDNPARFLPVHPASGFERIGWASNVRLKDGRLVADIEVDGMRIDDQQARYGFAGKTIMKRRRFEDGQCIVEAAKLLRVAEGGMDG